MRGLKVAPVNADVVKTYLIAHNLLDKDHLIAKENGVVIFPLVREFSPPWEFDVDFVDLELEERVRGQSLREALSRTLTEAEMDELIASYDIVGSIAIIEIPERLVPKEHLIAEQVLRVNPAVKTVLKKDGGHEGEYRTQRLAFITGDDTRLTTVIENGIRLRVNVEEAYYSIRMSTERKRIANLIKPGEKVLCLFSGVGPYPVVFSKHTKASTILGVEINPVAHELALENVALNRCTNVHLMLGDAHEILPRLARDGQTFNRITMPLPHTAHEFLDDILAVSEPGAMIHYYSFRHESDFENAVEVVRQAFRKHGKLLEEYGIIKAGQHAPRIWRVCVDARVK